MTQFFDPQKISIVENSLDETVCRIVLAGGDEVQLKVTEVIHNDTDAEIEVVE